MLKRPPGCFPNGPEPRVNAIADGSTRPGGRPRRFSDREVVPASPVCYKPEAMRVGLGIALTAALLALPATTAAGTRAGMLMHWTIDGVQRDAIVFAPASRTGAAKHPLIFAFHGHGGNAQGTVMQMHLQTVWPQAVVVYPQGLNSPSPLDPSATRPGWQFKSGDSNDRDLELFDAMLATLEQRYNVDPRRIYTTGFSNGGIFSYLLWAERAKTIAPAGEGGGARHAPGTPAHPPAPPAS